MDFGIDFTKLVTPEVLSSAIIPMIVAGLKILFTKIPKWSIPIVASALGIVAQALISLGGTTQFDPIIGLLIGLLGVGIREFLKGLKDAKRSIQDSRDKGGPFL